MPTYEYRCKACGHELEAQQGFHDDPLRECPACGGELRKKFAAPGITFKGSGFYKTDSRSGSGSRSGSSGASSTASDGGGSAAGAGDASSAGGSAAGAGEAASAGGSAAGTSAPKDTAATPA